MTNEEYKNAIKCFFCELQGNMAILENDDLKESIDLNTEIMEFRRKINSSEISDADLIGDCFGLIDEYIGYYWEKSTSEGYNYYCDLYEKKNLQ